MSLRQLRLLLLTLFFVCGSASQAIVFKGSLGYRYNLPTSKSNKYTGDVGYQFGARYHYLLKPNLSIKTGFSYSQLFFSWEKDAKLVTGGVSYLDVPVYAAYWLDSRSNIFIGPQGGYYLSKTCPEQDKDCSFNGPSLFRLSAVAGYEAKINKNVHIEIYFEYNVGPLSSDVDSVSVLGGNLLLKL